MNEQDLEILLMLDEYKNITKTAEKLHVTQPALTGGSNSWRRIWGWSYCSVPETA